MWDLKGTTEKLNHLARKEWSLPDLGTGPSPSLHFKTHMQASMIEEQYASSVYPPLLLPSPLNVGLSTRGSPSDVPPFPGPNARCFSDLRLILTKRISTSLKDCSLLNN